MNLISSVSKLYIKKCINTKRIQKLDMVLEISKCHITGHL